MAIAAEKRLRFIEASLEWRGSISRRDLINTFKLSDSRASLDLREYLLSCKASGNKNTDHDPSQKAYLRRDTFKPIFGSTTQQEAEALGIKLEIERIQIPRPKDAEKEKVIHRAISQKQALRVRYHSVSKAQTSEELIIPTHLVDDSNRIHIRAYSGSERRYRDFVLGRLEILETTPPVLGKIPQDKEWDEIETITLLPNPDLKETKALETEHGMKNRKLVIKTRKALGFYVRLKTGIRKHGIQHFVEKK